MDLGGPSSGCQDEACTREICLLVGGGIEDGYAGEGAGWGAGDGGRFGGLVEVDMIVGLAAFHEEAAEEEWVTVDGAQYVEYGLIVV